MLCPMVYIVMSELCIIFLWGCQGWQAALTWVSVSPEMVGFPAPIR